MCELTSELIKYKGMESPNKEGIDETCHVMRGKQIKVFDIKRMLKKLIIPPATQTDRLLVQPKLSITNSHFTLLQTQQS